MSIHFKLPNKFPVDIVFDPESKRPAEAQSVFVQYAFPAPGIKYEQIGTARIERFQAASFELRPHIMYKHGILADSIYSHFIQWVRFEPDAISSTENFRMGNTLQIAINL